MPFDCKPDTWMHHGCVVMVILWVEQENGRLSCNNLFEGSGYWLETSTEKKSDRVAPENKNTPKNT